MNSHENNQGTVHLWGKTRLVDTIIIVGLIVLIAIGIGYRFSWITWNQGTNLHPDEYGLTNTLTQLSLPKNLSDYFNTRISPISPYQKYDLSGKVSGDGPDNRMRWGQWPIILIRAAGELTGQTGYDEIRLLGRGLSALADSLAVLLIFNIGRRLFNLKIGLLAAALSSLAVMQIQQSHFMTVDNFAVFFAALAMYAAVRIAQRPCAVRPAPLDAGQAAAGPYRIDRGAWKWFLLFGVAFGMTVACKINLLPLAGMVLIAVFTSVADLKLKSRRDLTAIFWIVVLLLFTTFIAALITFRVTQPMSFRSPSGNTSFFSFYPNKDWMDSMAVAQSESSGIGGGPPGEQWAHRLPILFPLVNMVVWGMGLPLGIMAWAGVLWAGWLLVRRKTDWRPHLLPLVWVGGYFLFMGTRWVMSVRYFLPIYPFLCLYAAWGLAELWTNTTSIIRPKRLSIPGIRTSAAVLLTLLVVPGTLAWAAAFVNAVYRTDHTRIQAAEWMFQNIPAPFQLSMSAAGSDASFGQPVGAPDDLQITRDIPYYQSFVPLNTGKLEQVTIPHASILGDANQAGQLHIVISSDPDGKVPLDAATVTIQSSGLPGGSLAASGAFHQAVLEKGQTYYLSASSPNPAPVRISRTIVANEDWDEGLPMPYDGYDPFGQFYHGVTMEVRWYDDANKLKMFIETIQQADYIILPSQRSIWTTCRIPKTYPMTMEYYRALFDGRLGFDLAAAFQAPLQVGPLEISDIGGTLAWGKSPSLPLFNHNLLSAEEAFSVYDHPPVWVFKKRADFNLDSVKTILGAIDLSKVVIQSAKDATGAPCQ